MGLIIKETGFEQFLDPSGGAWIKALVMGEHGVGKTPSAACWPKPIIADCERGLMSVANKKVPFAEIKSSQDMNDLLDHLRRDGMKAMEKRKYLTLVIDTVDSYQRILIAERLRAEKKESLSGWADWGYLDAKMSQLIERMLNLPMNLVVNMHVKDDKDEDGENSILVKKARLKGDIKDTIFQDFDLIGQMETSYVAEKGERVLKRNIRWHAEPRFPKLRDRSGKLPRFTEVKFDENDYWQIFNAITEGVDDMSAGAELEQVDSTGTDVEPETDAKSGPVEQPKAPAKKTAKKAPAKKAVAKKTEPEPEVNKETGEITEPAAEEKPKRQPAKSREERDEDAKELVKNELGGEEINEDEPETPPDPEPEEEPKKEPAPEPKEEEGKKVTHCGDQPDSMKKFPAYDGCGKELNRENAQRSQIALLRTKTYICDECFDNWKANN